MIALMVAPLLAKVAAASVASMAKVAVMLAALVAKVAVALAEDLMAEPLIALSKISGGVARIAMGRNLRLLREGRKSAIRTLSALGC